MKGQPMTAFRTLSRAAAAATCLAGMSAQPSAAQTYPTQNINVIVAFAAGGIADGIGRLVGQGIGERLKQKVVMENRGGAGGNLAARAVATAAPDGYTLLATTTALAVNDTASKNRGYNTADLRPVAIVAISPDVLAVHPSNPAKTMKEFLANGKKASFTYGSAGVGTAPHIGAEYLFKEVAKVQSVHVPFTGGAPAVTAALGNHVNALVLTLPTVTPHINEGRLRGLGLASEKRVAAVNQVPTYREEGIEVLSGSWVGIFAPAKTPDAIVARLNAEINALMKAPDVQKYLAKIGFDPIVKDLAETNAYFKSEVANWGKMVRAAGVVTD
jgi:tripartite-type tricarboxylate transporter receptor subunit TctC